MLGNIKNYLHGRGQHKNLNNAAGFVPADQEPHTSIDQTTVNGKNMTGQHGDADSVHCNTQDLGVSRQKNHWDNRHHHQHCDYSKLATDLVMQESKAEEKNREKSRQSIRRYKIMEKLGEGAFSKVYKGVNIETGENVAVKVIQKYQLDEKQRASVLKEVALMRKLDHPNIVKFLDFIENDQFYYIVQELLEGGELFNQIVKYTYFSEDLARHVIIQVAEALLYLHESAGIVHRDLKPENIFFCPIPIIPSHSRKLRRSDDPNTKLSEGEFRMNYGGGGIGLVKIGDFGLSKQLIANNSLKTPCGTIGYTAPEIVKDMKYSKQVDMWALGCVLYILLCGFPPFFNDNIEELTNKVARGDYEFLSPWWDEISSGAKRCVSKLLTVDPNDRYTITEFLNDPWIMDFLKRSNESRQQETIKEQEQTASMETSRDSIMSDTTKSVQSSVVESFTEIPPLNNNNYAWATGNTVPRYESNYGINDIPIRNKHLDVTKNIGVVNGKIHETTDLFSPAVIAMKEALDISTAAHRLNEENKREKDGNIVNVGKLKTVSESGSSNTTASAPLTGRPSDKHFLKIEGETGIPPGLGSFNLKIEESSIIRRRRRKALAA